MVDKVKVFTLSPKLSMFIQDYAKEIEDIVNNNISFGEITSNKVDGKELSYNQTYVLINFDMMVVGDKNYLVLKYRKE